MNTKII